MEVLSFPANIQADSSFTTFMTNNKSLLDSIINDIINYEKMYGTAINHNDLTHFLATLFYKSVLPASFSSMGLTWDNTTLFTATEQVAININLRLKSYTI